MARGFCFLHLALLRFFIYPLDLANTRAAAESEFHDFTLAVKEQVIAQYGKSSDQVQSLGLKKKTEYKAPARRAKVAK